MNEAHALMILATARQFYKHGGKTSNKKYDTDLIFNLTPKHFRRNEAESSQGAQIKSYRDFIRPYNPTWMQLGQALLRDRITSGNCSEMAGVAAYLCSSRLPSGNTIYIGKLAPPGDHVFVLVSANGASPLGTSIWRMTENANNDNFWVIDAWSNVACRVRDYPGRLSAKFASWSSQNKVVMGRDAANNYQEEWQDPSSDAFKSPFLGSALRWVRADSRIFS